MSELFAHAYGHYAVAAFNVFNAEQVRGVFRGASEVGVPVIIQITPAARRYMSPELLHGMVRGAEAVYPGAMIGVHLDHGDTEHCMSAIESGFYNSVMIDASHEPFEQNVSLTKAVVERAHEKGIAVEAELGVLSGVEDDRVSRSSRFTDPHQASDFVQRTGCDSLAVAVGTSHGAYKFKGDTGLDLDVLGRIQKGLPRFPLVLHGASGVPPEEIQRINRAGGRLEEGAKGVKPEEIRLAIRHGVSKVNIATDMRLLWSRVHREFFTETPAQFDPVVPGKRYMEELTTLVKQKCQSFIVEPP
jgi:fructose-bisphosphate aldolase, class II